jgi:hypothetical protein
MRGRKGSDASTIVGNDKDAMRKQSLDTTAMAFGHEDDMGAGAMGGDGGDDGTSMTRSMMKRSGSSSSFSGGLVIDLITLKKLINKASCEFLQSLITSGVNPLGGDVKSSEKDSKEKDS